MKNIKLRKQAKPQGMCLLCEKTPVHDIYMPCTTCHDEYLKHGVLLIEVVGKDEHEKPTGRLMVIRDIAFEHVFNAEIPRQHVTKVEVGILQRMEEHIAQAE